jgi:protein-S-isoprenylcysteine O-methyltransferase Ste14
MTRVLAFLAIVPATAPLYFWVFWTWFPLWRRHRVATYVMLLGILGGLSVAACVWLDELLAIAVDTPVPVKAIGWVVVAIAIVFGTIADRQIGFRVRSFTPFFEPGSRLRLQTSGAYGVVRHPIYASGIYFQIGGLLVSGALAVAVALAVFTLGALWFTRQEERRLVELLDDPGDYDRYRARVPALFPRFIAAR